MEDKNTLEKINNPIEKSIENSADLVFSIQKDIEKVKNNINDTIKQIVEVRSELGLIEPLKEMPPSIADAYKKKEVLENKLKEFESKNVFTEPKNEDVAIEKAEVVFAAPPDNLPI